MLISGFVVDKLSRVGGHVYITATMALNCLVAAALWTVHVSVWMAVLLIFIYGFTVGCVASAGTTLLFASDMAAQPPPTTSP